MINPINGAGGNETFTPPDISIEIAEYLRPWIRKYSGAKLRVLEPAVGSGSLLWPLIHIAREENVQLEITAIDIKSEYLNYLEDKCHELGIEVFRHAKQSLLTTDAERAMMHNDSFV